MSMLLLGCEGKTKSDLRSALFLDDVDDVHILAKALRERLQRESEVVLHTANRLFANKSFTIKCDYLRSVKEYYGSEVQSLDFRKKTEPSRKTINDWVYERTEQKIKDMVPAGSISPDTSLVLASAIYFNGLWMETFASTNVTKKDFHVNSEKIARVDMMFKTTHYNFALDKKRGMQLLEIPYKGDGDTPTTSMLIALPVEKFGLQNMEKLLDATTLHGLEKKLVMQEIFLGLPKFKLEFNTDLVSFFSELGAPSIFAADANLSGISESEELMVSAIMHKAFIEVTEKGTEAAGAVTVELLQQQSSHRPPPPPPREFICDHPFQFFIKHQPTNVVLFAGRYVSPEE